MKNPTPAKSPELTSAFQAFNRLSRQLIASYQELEQQVCVLQSRLDQSTTVPPLPAQSGVTSSQQTRNLLESIPAAIIVLDGKGVVCQANSFANELLGQQLMGRLWRELVTEIFVPRQDDGHEISIASGRRVSISTSPMVDGGGQVVLISDVTEARELQQKLSLYQRLSSMGEMAASLAHQIRTPLATALLYTSHLKREHLDFDRRLEITDKLSNRLQHMESLIKDMLLFVRGGVAGQDEVCCRSLVQNLMLHYQDRLTEKSMHLETDIDCDCRLKGNQDALLSALGNLIENALEHCPAQARIQLMIRAAAGEYIDIMVKDNGPGISSEIQQRILEPFFTTRTRGTGLGLAVVDAVARAHNGYMWFQSEPGKGSVFSIRLPVTAYAQTALAAGDSSQAGK